MEMYRKILCLLVSVSASTFLWAKDEGFDVFLRGDANNDGAVDISDANFINDYLFNGGSAPSCMDAADANDDGQVDISDSAYLLEFLYQSGNPPPSPFPVCGEDPTSDNLGCNSYYCTP